MHNIRVKKRIGSYESIDLEKIHKVLSFACEDIAGVSVSEIALAANPVFFDGITTTEIHETLIKATADLITEECPNYSIVAGRLVIYDLRKQIFNDYTPDALYKHVKRVVNLGYYEKDLLNWYSEDEFNQMDKWIKHSRDENLTYAALEQFRGKYLIRNRTINEFFETPQIAFMLIAATLFHKYKDNRLQYVKDFYDALSNFDISLPTPIMAGVRAPLKQFSSCVLIECDDSLDSISATAAAIVRYVSKRAGIGIGAGRIRAIGSNIGNGHATHTGVIPFYKHFQTAVKSCSQGGTRNGAATVFYPIWHYEVEDLLVLKNNKGTEDNRVRHVDYGVQFNKLFYERLLNDEYITLFCPNDVPDMYDAFFIDNEKFQELYEAAERKTSIRKKRIKAIDLFSSFIQERADTGRIYLQNIDNTNNQSPFKQDKVPIKQSNLCCVTGDTMINVIIDDENKHLTINQVEQLVNNGREVYAFSYNIETGEYQYKLIEAAMLTEKDAELLRITCESTGRSVVCTPDHRIYTKNRGYVQAQDLNRDDKLVISD